MGYTHKVSYTKNVVAGRYLGIQMPGWQFFESGGESADFVKKLATAGVLKDPTWGPFTAVSIDVQPCTPEGRVVRREGF